MSTRIIHSCDLCGVEDVQTKTFYVDRGDNVHESLLGRDMENLKAVDVCTECQFSFIRAGIRLNLKTNI